MSGSVRERRPARATAFLAVALTAAVAIACVVRQRVSGLYGPAVALSSDGGGSRRVQGDGLGPSSSTPTRVQAPETPAPADPAPESAGDAEPRLARPVAAELEALPRALVQGRLVDAEGRSVAGVRLRLLPAGSEPAGSEMDGPLLAAQTDAAGEFTIGDVPAGAHELALGTGGEPFLAPVRIEVLAPRTRLDDIRIPHVGSLAVRVVDANGVPVTDAAVRCTGLSGGRMELSSDAEGNVSFTELPEGELRLFARHAEFGRTNRPLEFVPGRLESGSPGAAETLPPVELVLARR